MSKSVLLIFLLVVLVTVYSNVWGTDTDRIFWNLVCAILFPLLFWMLSFSSNGMKFLLRKIYVMIYGFLFFFLSCDKSWKQSDVVPLISPLTMSQSVKNTPTQKKTVIFIRHGESEWNLVFNKGIIKMPFRFILALIREIFLLPTGNSIFYDSPLNKEGIEQACELRDALTRQDPDPVKENIKAILRGDEGALSSIMVSSNLRRAVGTTVVGLSNRWKRTGEKIMIMSSLQEISRNVDTLALAPAKALPEVSNLDQIGLFRDCSPRSVFDPVLNMGNKRLRGNGLERQLKFCEFIFSREEDAIIVGGHSLYFRYFFCNFLPNMLRHKAKKQKILNSGVVSFELQFGQYEGQNVYQIDPKSIVEVHRGFANKK